MQSIQEINKVKLSIIIVNYNGKDFLKNCLNSISNKLTCSYEVIIVDNKSTDDSCTLIKNHFPWVTLIESPINTGFTGGNNLGARVAVGEYLLLLNNDTIIETDITPLLDEFKDHKVGVVGLRLIYKNGSQQSSVGYDHTPFRVGMSWVGIPFFSLLEKNEEFYISRHSSVDWLSGAFLLTPLALWNELKGLDESYFMYVEDVDYCKRVRDAGYSIVYTPSALVTHFEGGGKEWVGEKALLRTVHSYKVYLNKFYGKTTTLVSMLFLMMVFYCRGIFYALKFYLKPTNVLLEKREAFLKAAKIIFKVDKS